jgi:PAS domain S-box-containing protein
VPKNSPLTHQDFQKVHEHSTIGVLAIDPKGTIVYANPAAQSYFQSQEKKILDRYVFDLYQDSSNGRINEAKVLNSEEITDQEFVAYAGTENEYWVLISSKVYSDGENEARTYLFVRRISAIKKKEKLFNYLNKAAEELAKARDTQSALEQISNFIVPTFTTWFTIDLLKDDRLELLVLKHADPNKIEWAKQYRKDYPPDPNGNTGSAVVLKTGKAGFVPVVTDEMVAAIVPDPEQLKAVRQIGLKSVILAPLYARDKVTGVVNFVSSDDNRYFDEADFEFARNFANLIGLALENARLNEAASAEISLRKESEEKFRFLLDAIPHKMWTSAPDGRATFYNQQWYDYTGISGVENLRAHVWDMIHPDDRAIAAVEWPKAIQKGEEVEVEQRLMRYDGVYRWHLSRFLAHKNENGETLLWVGTSTDVDEQKVSGLELAAANEEMTAANEELASVNEEQATTNEELRQTQFDLERTIDELAASESRFRFLLNAVPQQVWTAAPDGKLNYVNDVVCNDFGLTMEEIVGHGWQKFIHPDDLHDCLEKWFQSLATGTEYLIEFRLLLKDGSYRWHLARAVPLLEDGAIKIWIGTNTDIDLQKNNEQKKDEFLSIASHELKTPLTNIKAFNQLLQRIKDPEKLEPFVKKSVDHVNRLEKLINDLLDVTKINAGKVIYTMEPFDFGKMISETVESARLIEQNHEIILHNGANVTYTGDQYRLEQVVNNLISNAVKYSPDGKQVIVTTTAKKENIIVSVQDFGIGIARENIGQLFDRYFRVDNTAMRFEGLGLGLFISSEILKRHNGSFWIESELGKGSTFYFKLPL